MDENCKVIRIDRYVDPHDWGILLAARAIKMLLSDLPLTPYTEELILLNDTQLDILHDSKIRGHHYGTRNLCDFYDHCESLIEGYNEQESIV